MYTQKRQRVIRRRTGYVDGGILWCVTELVSKEKLDEVVAIVKEVQG